RPGQASDAIPQIDQRPVPIRGNGSRRAAAKLVVEDLQGELAIIAGIDDGVHELHNRQNALPEHIAEMAAPVERVPVDLWRIGKLYEEDAISGDRADGIDVNAPRKAVKAVENEADTRMVGAPDDLPRVAMVIDMLAPGEGFITDAKATPLRPLAQL